jgi:flagellin
VVAEVTVVPLPAGRGYPDAMGGSALFVQTNVSALSNALSLQRWQGQIGLTLQQLTTGSRLAAAGTNPALSAIAANLENQLGGMQQALANAQEAAALLQTADGGLQGIQGQLQTLIALAIQSANDTNSAGDRADLQRQVDADTQAIAELVNQTAFNGKNLLAGVLGRMRFAVGPAPGDALALSLPALDPSSLGITGALPLAAAFEAETVPPGALADLALFGPAAASLTDASRNLLDTHYALAVTARDATLNGGDINGAPLSPTQSTAWDTQGGVAAGFIVYDGSSAIQLQLRVTTGAAPGTVQSVSYSLDGGRTFVPAGTDANGDYVLGNTGVTVLAAGITPNGQPQATDTYTLALTPATARFQLQDQAGQPIGPAATVDGIQEATQTVVVGDPAQGTAIAVDYQSAALFGVGANIALVNGVSPTSAPMVNPFRIAYAPGGQAATGAGGQYSEPASVEAGLSVMSAAAAERALGTLQGALAQVDAARGQVGALLDRLMATTQDLTTRSLALRASLGTIRDTDMALAAVALAQQEMGQRAAIAVAATANNLPGALLRLLP